MFATIMAVLGTGLSIGASAASVNSARSSARAKMHALEKEAVWNINAMERQKRDIYESNKLEAYGSGINPETGSTLAIIENNQKTMQEEIDFRKYQYAMELGNLSSLSKQKYLGLF